MQAQRICGLFASIDRPLVANDRRDLNDGDTLAAFNRLISNAMTNGTLKKKCRDAFVAAIRGDPVGLQLVNNLDVGAGGALDLGNFSAFNTATDDGIPLDGLPAPVVALLQHAPIYQAASATLMPRALPRRRAAESFRELMGLISGEFMSSIKNVPLAVTGSIGELELVLVAAAHIRGSPSTIEVMRSTSARHQN